MGYATGGSVEAVSIAGREFPADADADTSRMMGGYSNEILPNGDGTARVSKTAKAWSITGLVLEMDDNRGDHEFMQDIIDSKEYKNITITYASGVVYMGKGTVLGDAPVSSKSASMACDLGGPGKLTKQ